MGSGRVEGKLVCHYDGGAPCCSLHDAAEELLAAAEQMLELRGINKRKQLTSEEYVNEMIKTKLAGDRLAAAVARAREDKRI